MAGGVGVEEFIGETGGADVKLGVDGSRRRNPRAQRGIAVPRGGWVEGLGKASPLEGVSYSGDGRETQEHRLKPMLREGSETRMRIDGGTWMRAIGGWVVVAGLVWAGGVWGQAPVAQGKTGGQAKQSAALDAQSKQV